MSGVRSRVDTVPGVLAQRVSESPSAVAFQEEIAPGRWNPQTWAEFARHVQALRHALAASGLQTGDRLAIIAPVSLEWELLHHSALSMGIVVVGMDVHDLPRRIASMVELADITAIAVASPSVLSHLNPHRLSRCRLFIQLGDAVTDGWPEGAAPIAWHRLQSLGREAGESRPATPGPNDTATIIFTSGTTGSAKGIAYTHAQVCLAIDAICAAFPFVGPGSRLLCWLPLSNLFQRIVNLSGMQCGATSYLLSDPRRVMDVVGSVSPDIFVGVPRFYEKLYDGIRDRIAAQPLIRRKLVEVAWNLGRRASRARLEKHSISLSLDWAHRLTDCLILRRVRRVMGVRLRCMVTGSAPTPRHLLLEFYALGWLVLEAYGLSENIQPVAMNTNVDFHLGTVGRPLPGNQVVVGPDGTIKIRGPTLFGGYLGDAGPAPLDADGFYLTGDYGEIDLDGYLSLTGRTSELLKTSTGRRVAPEGIEAQLRRVRGVDQAVLIGAGRKCLTALCSLARQDRENGDQLSLESELSQVIAGMPSHDRPQAIALIDRSFSIERGELTPNLKLVRRNIEAQNAGLISVLYDMLDRQATAGERGLVVLRAPAESNDVGRH